MSDLLKRLRNPPFGAETSERNLLNAAADKIERMQATLKELLSDIDDVADGKLPYISAATLTRARQEV
jgi:hypothetical protein